MCACGADRPASTGAVDAELTIKGMQLTEFQRGKVRYTAEANSAAGSLQSGLSLEGVHVEHRGLPKTENQPADFGPLRIDAKRARLDTDSQNVTAVEFSGGVRIVDSHGRVLTTEAISCSFAEHKLSAPGPTELVSNELRAHAASIEGNLETQEFTLHGPITGTFDPNAVPH